MLYINVPQLLEDLVLALMQGIEEAKVLLKFEVSISREIDLPHSLVVAQKWIQGSCRFYPRFEGGAGQGKASTLAAANSC